MSEGQRTRFLGWLRYRVHKFSDLLDGHPRHEHLIVRLMIGGRDPIAHRYANEYALFPHPLRWLAKRIVLKHRRESWEEQCGGDPVARRLARKEAPLVACSRALLSETPRLHLIRDEIERIIEIEREMVR